MGGVFALYGGRGVDILRRMKIPKIIGHRGACGYAPENTLDSIRTAAELGAGWVELDVKLSSDGVAVIFHDDTLERTTNGSGDVAMTSFEVLEVLDAGSWYAEGFAGVKIPTLEEALDVIIEHGLGLNLEIKPCPGREVETAEVAMDVLSRYWDEMDKILISSFSHVSLEAAMDMAPEYKRALLLDTEIDDNWRDVADHLEVSAVHFDGRTATREQVEDIIEYGKLTGAYTINDAFRAKTLMSWGVDYVFSDVPDVISGAVDTKH